jgi:hypothetical protein
MMLGLISDHFRRHLFGEFDQRDDGDATPSVRLKVKLGGVTTVGYHLPLLRLPLLNFFPSDGLILDGWCMALSVF